MPLFDFIEANLDALVDDWAEFAGQLLREGMPLTERELQDSARHMLQRVAADMRLDQSGVQQVEKSRGEKGGGGGRDGRSTGACGRSTGPGIYFRRCRGRIPFAQGDRIAPLAAKLGGPGYGTE
ncbi:hypothetical protein [Caballeronia sp. 15715]|uniref:hypothetical protein n=1 Tax=unclassified Caballeronia TaxID=2646786 RepID=UPI0039E22EFB